MSGRNHSGWPNILDNKVLTLKAETLRAMLGLRPDEDAASHVERQLLAYLIHTHWPYMLEGGDDLKVLADNMLSYDLHPIITVSKEDLCDDCLEFFARFKNMFTYIGVTFHCVGDSACAAVKTRE